MALQQLNHRNLPPALPRRQATRPASYMLLLSALAQGWRIVDVELTPAKNGTGLLYLITLQHPAATLYRELILPCTALTENVLSSARTDD
jgi:hypothetical protein